jgi:hypothetical protein
VRSLRSQIPCHHSITTSRNHGRCSMCTHLYSSSSVGKRQRGLSKSSPLNDTKDKPFADTITSTQPPPRAYHATHYSSRGRSRGRGVIVDIEPSPPRSLSPSPRRVVVVHEKRRHRHRHREPERLGFFPWLCGTIFCCWACQPCCWGCCPAEGYDSD